ncbi:hypothetical protein BN946_scf184934.g13 [Trametes cinnabarina]|uniref:Transcription initiation factor IIF subunit beta n=1 Tax=Pycnoporus cinnabarinus TaxID=5643 RepID=A0A060STQ3_PYCCI|nr:hypothetical protein BN946_scf184934.g13 [Trametes cinnabarina]
MRFTAFDEYSPELHGRYEDWAPMDMDTSAEDSDSEARLMQVEPGDGQLLIVKIPKHLMERWSAIEEEGVHLATIRVYHPSRAAASRSATSASATASASASASASTLTAAATARIVLTLPPESDDDRLGPDEYEMQTSTADAAAPFNEYVVAEHDGVRGRSPAVPRGSRKGRGAHPDDLRRETKARRRIALAGMVTHHCNLRSVLGERLRQRVKARSVEANKPKRQTILLEHGASRRRVEASARRAQRPFLMPGGCRQTKGPRDHMTRLPRNALLDILFRLFEGQTQWSFKALRERTQQPEAYLKEVLPEIAYVHRVGQHRGLWELSAVFKYQARELPSGSRTPVPASGSVSGEGEDNDTDDDDLEEFF